MKIMKTLIIKSLLTSLCQREVNYPSLVKRGNFLNNVRLHMNLLVNVKYKILFFSICILLFACSSEKSAGVSGTSQSGVPAMAGSYSVEIMPINVTRNSTIYLVPHGFRLSDAKIEWSVNGIPVTGSASDKFSTSGTKKKDEVQARVEVQGKGLLSNVIEIENSLPRIDHVKIMPEVFKPGDVLYVEASGSDIDGDDVTISYEWTKNGEPAGSSKQIESPLKKGDKVDVKITPFDGEAYGRSVILHREIVNLPPRIIENNKHSFDGNTYTYQVNATDPDGDPLTYSLKEGSPGMTIDPASGLIKWNVPADFTGRASYTVSVADGHGGQASQTLTLDIKQEQKK